MLNAGSDTDKIFKKVLLAGAVLIFFVVTNNLAKGNILVAKGFTLGAVSGLLYLRMQALYAKNLLPKNGIQRLNKTVAQSRMLIIVAVLFVTVRRPDLFNMLAMFAGLFSIHFLSVIMIAFEFFKDSKKKLTNSPLYSN